MTKQNKLDEMHLLANSIRRVYNRLLHTTDQLHEDAKLSAAKRTLLQDIYREGPQTVPALAASRYVSRQIVQTQVNELRDADYLETKANPEHKRSSLIALTAKGRSLVEQMYAKETAFMDELGWLPEDDELVICRSVLDQIYDKLKT